MRWFDASTHSAFLLSSAPSPPLGPPDLPLSGFSLLCLLAVAMLFAGLLAETVLFPLFRSSHGEDRL